MAKNFHSVRNAKQMLRHGESCGLGAVGKMRTHKRIETPKPAAICCVARRTGAGTIHEFSSTDSDVIEIVHGETWEYIK